MQKTLAKKRVSGAGATKTQKDRVDGKEEKLSSKLAKERGEQSPFLHDGLSLKDLVLLGEIIDKIAPATEEQGMKELYAFQQSHPDIDIPSLFRLVGSCLGERKSVLISGVSLDSFARITRLSFLLE